MSAVTLVAATRTFGRRRDWHRITTRLMHVWSGIFVVLALVYGVFIVRAAVSGAFGASWMGKALSIALIAVSTIGAMIPAAIPQVVIRLLRES